jgi:hypothetical protein
MRWTGDVAHRWEMRYEYIILIEKHDEKRPHVRCIRGKTTLN